LSEENLVITGASAICPLGLSREAAIESLRAGSETFSERPAPSWTGSDTITAAWVRDFKPTPVIPAMKARRMDRSAQMAIVAADAALREAGWDIGREGKDSLGLFIGSGFCGTHSSAFIVKTLSEQGPAEVSAAAFPNTVPNAPAGWMAIHFGLEGPSATILQTGSTADGALEAARYQIGRGQCRAFLWGGVDELSEYLWFGLRKLGLTGKPSADQVFGRPFDPRSRGFVAGESAAMLLVETEDSARSRGARPLAAIEYAATGAVEARPWGFPAMDQVGKAEEFFRPALDGGLPDLVIGCANGNPRLDRFEAELLRRLVGDRVPVWAAKGAVGEGMASTALRAVVAVWLIEEGLVPGNRWLSGVAAKNGLLTPVETIERPVGRVFITTVSAGGTLGAVVIKNLAG